MRGVDIWQLGNVITLLVTMASAGHVWAWHSEQRRAYPALSGMDQRMCWLNLRAAQIVGIAFLMVFGLGCYELWQGHLVDMRGTAQHPARPAAYVVNGTVMFTLIWCFVCWGVTQLRHTLQWVLRGDDEAHDDQDTPQLRPLWGKRRRVG